MEQTQVYENNKNESEQNESLVAEAEARVETENADPIMKVHAIALSHAMGA